MCCTRMSSNTLLTLMSVFAMYILVCVQTCVSFPLLVSMSTFIHEYTCVHRYLHRSTVFVCVRARAQPCVFCITRVRSPCLVSQTHKGCLGTLALGVAASHLRGALMIPLIQFNAAPRSQCMISDNV